MSDHPNGKHSDSQTTRWTAYITRAEKRTWNTKMHKAAVLDGIRNPNNGTFLSRLLLLRFDDASIRRYLQTHEEAGEHAARR